MSTNRPLCVDLDGTLIASDVLEESLLVFLKESLLNIFKIALWFFQGRAYLKRMVADHVTLNPAHLPYHQDFLTFLKGEHASGRTLILVTASDAAPARQIAAHIGLFEDVMASDGATNLRSHAKAKALVDRYGEKGFDYAGNAVQDLPVWEKAHTALAVETPEDVVEELFKINHDVRLFKEHKAPVSWQDFFSPFAFFTSLIYWIPFLIFDAAAVRVHSLLGWIALWALTSSAELGADLVSMRDEPMRPEWPRRTLLATGAMDLPKAFWILGLGIEVFILCAFFMPLIVTLTILGVASAYYVLEKGEPPRGHLLATRRKQFKTGLIAARALPSMLLVIWSLF
ncbi:MAG: hypothetical protein C0514_04490 [Candidatus Puniceispirillum sp.]|nr:hypothetical protein [Candidatus Puniceispirillum sp.]